LGHTSDQRPERVRPIEPFYGSVHLIESGGRAASFSAISFSSRAMLSSTSVLSGRHAPSRWSLALAAPSSARELPGGLCARRSDHLRTGLQVDKDDGSGDHGSRQEDRQD
jgi:hypothetical protein